MRTYKALKPNSPALEPRVYILRRKPYRRSGPNKIMCTEETDMVRILVRSAFPPALEKPSTLCSAGRRRGAFCGGSALFSQASACTATGRSVGMEASEWQNRRVAHLMPGKD